MTPPRYIRVSKRVDLPRRQSIRRYEANVFGSIPTPYFSRDDPSSSDSGSQTNVSPPESNSSSDPVQEGVSEVQGAREHDVDLPKPEPLGRSVSHKTHRRSQYLFIGRTK
jgi:hypothetical protein